MKDNYFGAVRYFTFKSLENTGVIQAVFTRCGGVSTAPFASLNTGATVGDEPDAVAENRQRCFMAVERNLATMFDVWQVHSSDVVFADRPRPAGQPHQRADVILTNQPGVTLFMRFADCVPVFLVDPVRRVIGMVHAGWVGSVNRISAIAVQAMSRQYGSQPDDIVAAIGPSIGVEHYPVGGEVVERVKQSFGDDSRELLVEYKDGIHLDLWKTNQLVLEAQGVRQIEQGGICTACHLEHWFSHRGEAGRTGRFGALLALAG